jgi:general secretion pathway protein M
MRLQNLTKREQWILAGTGVILVLLTLYLVGERVTSNYHGMEGKIQKNKEELERVSHLRDQYRSLHQELDGIKSKLDKKEAGFSLLSFIEDLANQQNIRENIASFKPDKKSLNEAYRELSVDLVIDNITLLQLVEFIYHIENSNHLVKVKRLRIKSRFDNPDLLNVTFQVSTYEKI